MVDVEFIVQYLVLAHSHGQPRLLGNLGNIALLRIAGELGLIDAQLAGEVGDAYRRFRKLQHELRLNNAEFARVPADGGRGGRRRRSGRSGGRCSAPTHRRGASGRRAPPCRSVLLGRETIRASGRRLLMTSTRLDGKRVLLTQSGEFMGPALTEVFRDMGADVIADPRALDQDPTLPAVLVRGGGTRRTSC